jgi:hypothetical protein
MGQSRLELQTLLETLISDDPEDKITAHFQPPLNIQLTYPCIIYKRDSADTKFAGNRPYRYTKRYQVMVIDEDPDSPIPDKIAELPLCTFDRHYTADQLNHDVFNLYF